MDHNSTDSIEFILLYLTDVPKITQKEGRVGLLVPLDMSNKKSEVQESSKLSAKNAPKTLAPSAIPEKRRETVDVPANIVIPENHATVTKSHRIIDNSPIPSPPRPNRTSVGGQNRKRSNQQGTTKKQNSGSKPANNVKVQKRFKDFASLKAVFSLGNKETSTAKFPNYTTSEEEFKNAHVVSPIWATDYSTPHTALQASLKRQSKELIHPPPKMDFGVGDSSLSAPYIYNSLRDPEGNNSADRKNEFGRLPLGLGAKEMKSLDNHSSTTTVNSGYLNMHRFTGNIITTNPRAVRGWVQFWTKRLYLFWVALVLAASLLNSIFMYAFHFIPHDIFARDFLYRILLRGEFNFGGMAGVLLAFLAISIWGCAMLTHPSPKSIVYRNTRWPFVGLAMIYVTFCMASQVYECVHLYDDLETVMIKDIMNPRSFKKTKLEAYTQTYYHCCGIHYIKDWSTYGHLEQSNRSDLKGGYPPTCCNTDTFPQCSHILPVLLRTPSKDDPSRMDLQLWDTPCFEAEYILIVTTTSLIFIIESFCMISIIGAIVLLRIVLKHTNDAWKVGGDSNGRQMADVPDQLVSFVIILLVNCH
ncbi:unnamed protein product [Allacma fusca]|uniref:Uncharacterized protein n=1 Tax=Allacma fusca TaxID=39272 RepID=A0A8J2NS24_9HEXA|nr:unnamed protein product [Allacma fusca]